MPRPLTPSLLTVYNAVVGNVAALKRIALATHDPEISATDLALLDHELALVGDAVVNDATVLNEHILRAAHRQQELPWDGENRRGPVRERRQT